MNALTNISKTLLSATVKAAFASQIADRRNVTIVVVRDDSFRLSTYNTRWDGGTRNQFFNSTVESTVAYYLEAKDGGDLPLLPGNCLVQESVFCGKLCDPAFYVRNADLCAFFGINAPAGMPAEIAADYIEDQANTVGGSKGRKLAASAALIRNLCGLISA